VGVYIQVPTCIPRRTASPAGHVLTTTMHHGRPGEARGQGTKGGPTRGLVHLWGCGVPAAAARPGARASRVPAALVTAPADAAPAAAAAAVVLADLRAFAGGAGRAKR
jgi:hypothetical protein